jgi:multiple sugar transport system substrate-binding protein
MNRSMRAVLGAAAAATLAFTAAACVSDGPEATEVAFPTGPVEISLTGWSLSTEPQFQLLADGFKALHPNVTVKIKEYDAAQYDALLPADLAAGTAPDVVVLKNLRLFYTYHSNGLLKDVTDIADKLPAETNSVENYRLDGKLWAVPYRLDPFVLFYNKDLFDQAGVAYPDGSWTWDDYARVAKDLTAKLHGPKGTYLHSWHSMVTAFALVQTPGAKLDTGDYSWAKPYFARALDLQESGAQDSLANITTNKLGYQAQFGNQQAAMLPMGTWFVGTLLAAQTSGTYAKFNWGFAPAPQYDRSTTGTDKTPVTFGEPTGLAINGAIADDDKFTMAKEFLRYASGPEGAKALAAIGTSPANSSAEVAAVYFGNGAPNDALSKFAWTTHDIRAENPPAKYTAGVQNILLAAHTAIMTKSAGIDDAIAEAERKAKSEVLNQ